MKDLSLIYEDCSGSRISSSATPFRRMKKIYMMGTINGFVILETNVSSSNMERMFPLSCLQSISLRRQIDWELDKEQSGVTIEKIVNHTAFPAGYSWDVVGLLPSSLRSEYPRGETPKQAGTFISKFMEAKVTCPNLSFRRLDGCTLQTWPNGREWWVLSSRRVLI